MKRMLGVKVNDLGHDEVLNEALNQAKASVKKSGAKAVKESNGAAVESEVTEPAVARKKSLAAGLSKIKGKLSLKKSSDPVSA